MARRSWRPGVPEMRAVGRGALLAALVAALGAPLGLLWRSVAPPVPLRMGADGPVLTTPQPEQFAAADGWFALLGAAFGVAVAVAVWVLRRDRRGPAQLVCLVFGAYAAGLFAWWLGRQIGLAEYRALVDAAAEGTLLRKPPDLRGAHLWWAGGVLPLVRGDVLAPPLGVAIAYTLLAGWSRYADLRADDPAAGHLTGESRDAPAAGHGPGEAEPPGDPGAGPGTPPGQRPT